jgi:hypothetical protein
MVPLPWSCPAARPRGNKVSGHPRIDPRERIGHAATNLTPASTFLAAA